MIEGVEILDEVGITLFITISEEPAHENEREDDTQDEVKPDNWRDVDQWHIVFEKCPLDGVDRVALEEQTKASSKQEATTHAHQPSMSSTVGTFDEAVYCEDGGEEKS